MNRRFAARRYRALREEWRKSSYWSRDPSHPKANLNLRLRRSLSWLGRAERERKDCDASFVFYWIAFNAAYGQQDSPWHDQERERDLYHKYLQRIIDGDWGALKTTIWPHLESPIKSLMNNEHVFQPSWRSQDQESDSQDWKQKFKESQTEMARALHQRNLALSHLCELLDRLYTLRNQLLRGGATYRGRVNRPQVEDGALIMAGLMPCFIKVMIDNPETDWGFPATPSAPTRFLAGQVSRLLPGWAAVTSHTLARAPTPSPPRRQQRAIR